MKTISIAEFRENIVKYSHDLPLAVTRYGRIVFYVVRDFDKESKSVVRDKKDVVQEKKSVVREPIKSYNTVEEVKKVVSQVTQESNFHPYPRDLQSNGKYDKL